MNKFVLACVFILAGFAIAAWTPPDGGTPAEDVLDNVTSITFTNGWSIICTNELEFVSP